MSKFTLGIKKLKIEKKAFTLLELLLVIAIIATLSGLVIFNLRPADVLQSANNVKRIANSNEIKKAIEAYALDHDGNLPTSLQGQPSGEYTICRQAEESCPVGSISLDELVSGGYLSVIPLNEGASGEKTTGYAIKYDAITRSIKIMEESGPLVIVSNKNINTDIIATGRTCADGINYSVIALTTNSATLSTTPAAGCLAANDTVLLINLQGISTNYANVGNYELLTVQSASATNVTFTSNKTKYYGNGASDDTNLGTATTNQRVMLQRIPEYKDLTISNGATLTASAWDGTKGGVLAFTASGSVTINGTIDLKGKGYRGGSKMQAYNGGWGEGQSYAYQGETYSKLGSLSQSANNGAGGGGAISSGGCTASGAGGSYATAGGNGGREGWYSFCQTSYGGSTYGIADLSKLFLGSGGGGGGGTTTQTPTDGGSGGGIVLIISDSITITGSLNVNGSDAVTGSPSAGGGGAGGSVKLNTGSILMGTSLITALGGSASASTVPGIGGVGRIAISGTVTGTTNPTYTAL